MDTRVTYPQCLNIQTHRWTNRPTCPNYPQVLCVAVVDLKLATIAPPEQKEIVHNFAPKGPPIMPRLILASASPVRHQLLAQAGVSLEALPARIDEEQARAALEAEGAKPRDIADALAEMKARKLAERHMDATVIGCDQVLDFDGQVWGKAETPDAARAQLRALRGKTHRLISAVVLYERARPVWRHVGEVRLTMRLFSDDYLDDYLARNWDEVRHSVGCYQLENEGVRLFSDVQGDYFTVLGLPLLPLLNYLGQRGFIAA